MGMYNDVWTECPKCKNKVWFQSKSGACDLKTYHLDDAPEDVLDDLNGGNGLYPEMCDNCHNVIELVVVKGATKVRNANHKPYVKQMIRDGHWNWQLTPKSERIERMNSSWIPVVGCTHDEWCDKQGHPEWKLK